MTELKMGDAVRVSTHPRAVNSAPPQQPGATGVVSHVSGALKDAQLIRVRHPDGVEPWYRADDLIAICEVATAAGEETPEQRWRERMVHRLGALEQRVAELEPRKAMASEPRSIALVPSEAAETIRQLRERVEELEQSVVDHAVAVSNLEHKLAARGERSPEWVEGVERTLYRLAREMGTNGIWDAAVDRAIELRQVTSALGKALHLPGCDHPVNRLLDETRARLQFFDRMADPGAYGESDPEKLGDLVLEQLRRGTNQIARVRERLVNMMGCPGSEPLATILAWLEPRMAIMSELELFSPDALNDTGEGLEHLGGEESAHIGALLYRIAALQSPSEQLDTTDDLIDAGITGAVRAETLEELRPDSEPGPERSRR